MLVTFQISQTDRISNWRTMLIIDVNIYNINYTKRNVVRYNKNITSMIDTTFLFILNPFVQGFEPRAICIETQHLWVWHLFVLRLNLHKHLVSYTFLTLTLKGWQHEKDEAVLFGLHLNKSFFIASYVRQALSHRHLQ